MSDNSHSSHDTGDEIVLNQQNVLPSGFIGFIFAIMAILALAQAGTGINFASGENAYNIIQSDKENLKNYTHTFKKDEVKNTQPTATQEEHSPNDGHEH